MFDVTRRLGDALAAFGLAFALGGCAAARLGDAAAAPVAPQQRDFRAELDRIGNAAIRAVPLDALSIVVIRGDERPIARAYGKSEKDTTYRIGSISKLVTAVGIAQLVEAGRLDLEDTLGSILPNRLPAPDVTIAQLLNHTSGLATHEEAAVRQWLEHRTPITDDFVWQIVAERPRVAEPGKVWSYASSNFHLLGLVIEAVAKTDLATYVEQEIARPLALDSLRLCSGQPAGRRQRPDYVARDGAVAIDESWLLPGIGGAGGMCASAPDVARLIHSISRGALLDRATLERLTRPTSLGGGVNAGYGLGVRLGTLDGHRKWGHSGGGMTSNRAIVAHYPEHDLTISVLTNTEREDTPLSPIHIEALVARAVLGLPAARAVSLPLGEDASSYVGTYVSPNRRTRISIVEGHLAYSPVGDEAPPTVMSYQGGTAFVPDPQDPGYQFVFELVGGRAVAMSAHDNGWFAGVRTRVE